MRCAVAVSAKAYINSMMIRIRFIYSRLILLKAGSIGIKTFSCLLKEAIYVFSLQAVALFLVCMAADNIGSLFWGYNLIVVL